MLKIGILRAKGIRKNVLILFGGGSAPCPSRTAKNYGVIGKDVCPGSVVSFSKLANAGIA